MSSIRPARWADGLWLYRLRHDPTVVAASFSPPPTLLRHLWWFTARLLRSRPHLWIITVDGVRAGWVREDDGEVEDDVEVSVAIHPAYRGHKLASRWILVVSDFLHGVEQVRPYARIKPGNTASVRAFLGAGYRWVGDDRYEYAP